MKLLVILGVITVYAIIQTVLEAVLKIKYDPSVGSLQKIIQKVGIMAGGAAIAHFTLETA
jgi:hypothetical protein